MSPSFCPVPELSYTMWLIFTSGLSQLGGILAPHGKVSAVGGQDPGSAPARPEQVLLCRADLRPCPPWAGDALPQVSSLCQVSVEAGLWLKSEHSAAAPVLRGFLGEPGS